jgi:hypothetical protein
MKPSAVRVSPAPMPISCSRSRNELSGADHDWMPSPVPPSKATPSMVPLKLIVTRSPVLARRPRPSPGQFWSAMRLIGLVDVGVGHSTTGFSTRSSWKSASAIVGTTSIATV